MTFVLLPFLSISNKSADKKGDKFDSVELACQLRAFQTAYSSSLQSPCQMIDYSKVKRNFRLLFRIGVITLLVEPLH